MQCSYPKAVVCGAKNCRSSAGTLRRLGVQPGTPEIDIAELGLRFLDAFRQLDGDNREAPTSKNFPLEMPFHRVAQFLWVDSPANPDFSPGTKGRGFSPAVTVLRHWGL